MARTKAGWLVYDGPKVEWAVALLCIFAGLAGISLSISATYWNSWSHFTLASNSSGILLRRTGDVRVRLPSSLVWLDLDFLPHPIARGATVFTSETGIAELLLQNSNSVEISPNSLVLLNEDYQQAIDIKQGSLRVNLRKNSRPITVRAEKKTYEVSSLSEQGTVEVSVRNGPRGTPHLQFMAGTTTRLKLAEKADSNNVKQTATLEPMQIATSHDGSEKLITYSIGILPLAPKDKTTTYLTHPDMPIQLDWKWESPTTAQTKQVELKIRGTADKTVNLNRNQTSVQVRLPSGAYEWRIEVAQINEAPAYSPWNSFTVNILAPPTPLGPQQGSIFPLSGRTSRTVVLSWKPPSSIRFIPEAEIEREGSPPVRLRSENSSAITFEALPGRYRWKVRSLLMDGKHSEWSLPLEFAVLKNITDSLNPVPSPSPSPIPAAQLPKIEPVRTIDAPMAQATTHLRKDLALDRVSVLLQWKSLPGVRKYEVTILGPDRAVHLKHIVNQPRYEFVTRTLDKTTYAYQVVATLASGQVIQSAVTPIVIQFSPPRLKTPQEGAKVETADTLLVWEKTGLTTEYEIQLALDRVFSKRVVGRKTSRNWEIFKELPPGQYYWRVRSRNPHRESQWSELGSFTR